MIDAFAEAAIAEEETGKVEAQVKLEKLRLEKEHLLEKAKIKLQEVKLRTERKQAKLREKEMEHERMRWEHEARMAGLGDGRNLNAGYTVGTSTFESQYQPEPSHHTPSFIGSHASLSSSSSPAQIGNSILQDDLAASLPGPSSELTLNLNHNWQLQHGVGGMQGQGSDNYFGA